MRAALVLAGLAALGLGGAAPPRIEIGETSTITVALPALNAPFVGVDSVGDVNGDGRGDISVRAVQGHAGDARRSFVVFGRGEPRSIPASRLRSAGFEIAGGAAASAAGDLDRDGLDDMIATDCLRGTLAVLYGRKATGLLTLDTAGRAGYRIARAGNCANAVATRRHLLVGGCSASAGRPGAAYLLPPRRRGAARIDAPTAAVARITGAPVVCPVAVADVNGDRRDDAVVYDDDRTLFVVFDVMRRGTVNLRSLGARGFRIRAAREVIGPGVAGDVNGDRRADIVFGDRTQTAAYIVFGKATKTAVDAAALGLRGLTIRGERDTNFPFAASAAGDVNRDGLGDVLLGAPGASDRGDGATLGSAFVVYGRAEGGEVTAALRIDGRGPGTAWGIGGAVAAIDDLDGDGRRELAIAGGYEGRAYVLLSTGLR